MIPNILIIEDDPDIARVLQFTLQEQGYAAHIANDGNTGISQARTRQPDLILVDLGLPDMQGDEVVRRLRHESRTPIMVLSAQDCAQRKVKLLDAGADDYVTKPYRCDELLVRVGVQLRHSVKPGRLQIGELTISPSEHRVWYTDHEVRLSRREEQILHLLARQPGRVFSRDELREELWGDQPCENTTLDTHITNLRRKLRDAGANGMIRTVRGVGFGLHPQGQKQTSPGRSQA